MNTFRLLTWRTTTETFADVMNLPAALLYVLTLVFPALLAWSAATIVPRLRKPAVQTPGAPPADS